MQHIVPRFCLGFVKTQFAFYRMHEIMLHSARLSQFRIVPKAHKTRSVVLCLVLGYVPIQLCPTVRADADDVGALVRLAQNLSVFVWRRVNFQFTRIRLSHHVRHIALL